jgi:hypothetical protein
VRGKNKKTKAFSQYTVLYFVISKQMKVAKAVMKDLTGIKKLSASHLRI